jgi:beta-glucanase (GH16 family)
MQNLMSSKFTACAMACATLAMLIFSGDGQAGETVKNADQAVQNHSGTMPIATDSTPEKRAPRRSEQPSPAGQDAAYYVLAFSEEFDNGFNTRLWNDHIWYEKSNPTKNYEVSNGTLKIWPERDATGKFVNRMLDTDGHFSQTYGYFEMEAKLPVGKGPWPAFWLYNHLINNSFFPEIDIMEAYPGGGAASGWSDKKLHPTAYGATVHPMGASGPFKGPAINKMLTNLGDLSAGFHKYGLKWEKHKQTFYFDGKEMHSVNVSMSDPLYILLDLQFGSASGTPDDTTPTGKSNSFEINYVRTWKFR